MRLEPRGMPVLAVGLIAVALLVPGCNQPVPLSSGGPVDSSVSAAGAQPQRTDAAAESPPAGGAGEGGKAAQPAAADAGPAGGGQTAAATPGAASAADAAVKGAPAAAGTATPQEKPPAEAGASAQAAPGAAGNAPASTAPAGDAASKGAPAAAGTAPTEEKPAAEAGAQPSAADQAAAEQTAKPAKAAAAKNIVKEAGKTPVLTFEDLYAEMTVRGVKLSDKVNQLAGKKVEMTGFMAPPLTAKVNFFVLTKVALTVCPFCSTDADWPADIVVVFMPKGKDVTPTEHQVKVTGTLSVGSQTDEETGFVSLIRINADSVEVLK